MPEAAPPNPSAYLLSALPPAAADAATKYIAARARHDGALRTYHNARRNARDALAELTAAADAQARALENFLKAAKFPMVPP